MAPYDVLGPDRLPDRVAGDQRAHRSDGDGVTWHVGLVTPARGLRRASSRATATAGRCSSTVAAGGDGRAGTVDGRAVVAAVEGGEPEERALVRDGRRRHDRGRRQRVVVRAGDAGRVAAGRRSRSALEPVGGRLRRASGGVQPARAPSSHCWHIAASASPRSHSASDSSRVAPPVSSRRTTSTSSSRACLVGRSARRRSRCRCSATAPPYGPAASPTGRRPHGELALGEPGPQRVARRDVGRAGARPGRPRAAARRTRARASPRATAP